MKKVEKLLKMTDEQLKSKIEIKPIIRGSLEKWELKLYDFDELTKDMALEEQEKILDKGLEITKKDVYKIYK